MRVTPVIQESRAKIVLGQGLSLSGYRQPKILFSNREMQEALKGRFGKFSPCISDVIDEPNKLNIEKVIAKLKDENGWNQPYDFVVVDFDPVFHQLLERMDKEGLDSRIISYCGRDLGRARTYSDEGINKGFCGISDYELDRNPFDVEQRLINALGEEGLERLSKPL